MIRVLFFLSLALELKAFNFGVYSVHPIPKDLAAEFLCKARIRTPEIKNEFSNEIASEISNAHKWCTLHRSNPHYSILSICKTYPLKLPHYFVLFRQNHEIFTVVGLVRLQQETCLSAPDVFLMLRKECDAKGFLQLHELKSWCNGRYSMEDDLEKMFSLN